jgi:hypothetical protein
MLRLLKAKLKTKLNTKLTTRLSHHGESAAVDRTTMRTSRWVAVATVSALALTTVAATVRTLPEINTHLSSLLAPFNNANTQTELAILAAAVTPEHLVELSAQGQIAKFGLKHDITLRLDRGSYLHGDGSAPTIDLDLILAARIADIFGQQTVNDIAPRLDEFARDQAKGFLRRFGPAARFDANVQVQRDDLQNVVSVTLDIALQIDINALPSGLTTRDVDVLSAQMRLEAGQQGGRVVGQIALNGQGSFLQDGGAGLRGLVQGLFDADPAADARVTDLIKTVDGLINGFANYQ